MIQLACKQHLTDRASYGTYGINNEVASLMMSLSIHVCTLAVFKGGHYRGGLRQVTAT